MTAFYIDQDHIQLIWPRISHFIKRAFERGDLGRFDEVEPDILAGRALVWTNQPLDGAAVTKIYLTEKSRVCEILAYGGRIDRVHLIETIENYAKGMGCDLVRILGRRGWLRVMKDYTAPKVILEKRL